MISEDLPFPCYYVFLLTMFKPNCPWIGMVPDLEFEIETQESFVWDHVSSLITLIRDLRWEHIQSTYPCIVLYLYHICESCCVSICIIVVLCAYLCPCISSHDVCWQEWHGCSFMAINMCVDTDLFVYCVVLHWSYAVHYTVSSVLCCTGHCAKQSEML